MRVRNRDAASSQRVSTLAAPLGRSPRAGSQGAPLVSRQDEIHGAPKQPGLVVTSR